MTERVIFITGRKSLEVDSCFVAEYVVGGGGWAVSQRMLGEKVGSAQVSAVYCASAGV